MSQVLAFTQRLDFKTLLEIECKALTGFAPLVRDSAEEFISMLELFGEIDVLVIDEPKQESLYLEIVNALTEKNKNVKNLLILSDQNSLLKGAKSFPRSGIVELLNHLKTLLNPSKNVEGFISFPVDSLLHFKILPIDLFVKISEGKFIKRIPAHEEIDESTVTNFKLRGIDDLYFEKKHNRDFSLMLINNMINKVEKDYASPEARLKAASEVFVTTKDIVRSIGLPPIVMQVCETVMEKITDDVFKGRDHFSTFLNRLKSNTELAFHYRYVELTSYIVTQMVEGMEVPDKQEKVKTVVFAAFFCDVALSSSDQIHVRRADQLDKLSYVEQKEINDHALRASEMVSKHRNAPWGVETIIKQHHGSLSGIGFPEKISPQTVALAKCLMAAQELAYGILTEDYRPAQEVLEDTVKRYKNSPLEEHLLHFEKNCRAHIK